MLRGKDLRWLWMTRKTMNLDGEAISSLKFYFINNQVMWHWVGGRERREKENADLYVLDSKDPEIDSVVSFFWHISLLFSKCWRGMVRGKGHPTTRSKHMTNSLWRAAWVSQPLMPPSDVSWGRVCKHSRWELLVCPGLPSRGDRKIWRIFDLTVAAVVSGITLRSALLSQDSSYL